MRREGGLHILRKSRLTFFGAFPSAGGSGNKEH